MIGGASVVLANWFCQLVLAVGSEQVQKLDRCLGLPIAGHVILHRQGEHDEQPEESGASENPHERRVVAYVHEKQDHHASLEDGDTQGHGRAQSAQLHEGGTHGDCRHQEQEADDRHIHADGRNMRSLVIVLVTAAALYS